MYLKRKIWQVFFVLCLGMFLSVSVQAAKLQVRPLNPQFQDFLQNKTLKTGKSWGLIPNPWNIPKHKISKIPSTPGILGILPTYYDLRLLGYLTPVKDQGIYGTCWAFATYGSLESDLLALGDIAYDFSENNLVNKAGFDLTFNDGGNICMSSAYLARGTGPVDELCDPYPNPGVSPDCPRLKYIENMVFLPGRATVLDNDFIKQAIYDHGAVYSSMYWDNAYYDSANYTYYFPGFWFANHAIVIVGWDDAKIVNGAPGPGAWIVRNSWGTSFGENGYFYVSYYDTVFAKDTNAYFIDIPDVNNGTFYIYQYDELGMENGIGCDTGYVYGANVFPMPQNGEIQAVSFFLNEGTPQYEVNIYTNCTDPNNISSPPVATLTGNSTYSAYVTIPLSTPIPVAGGTSFCVVLKITQAALTGSYPLGVEEKIPGFSSPTGAAGQSYISCNGTGWEDLYLNYYSSLGLTNNCIKVLVTFTGNPQVDLKVNGSNGPVSLNTLDTVTLTASVLPGSYLGTPGDFWLAARDLTTGKFYFYDGVNWVRTATPISQANIDVITNAEVFSATIPSTWSGKSFTFYYGVDTIQNGLLDKTNLFYDSVTINIL